MSLYSWKTAHYNKPSRDDTLEKALEKSIAKFKGCRELALRANNVSLRHGKVYDNLDGSVFVFDSHSCALCYLYLKEDNPCAGCPLFENGMGCLSTGVSVNKNPFEHFRMTNNPEPMIKHLERFYVETEAQ